MNKEDRFKRLKELTHEMSGPPEQGWLEYKHVEGTSFGFGIYKTDEVAIQRARGVAGSLFEEHVHDEHEHIVVFSGCLAITMHGKRHVLRLGDGIHIPLGTPHSAEYLEDSWVIAITVPGSKDFPNAPD